MAYQGKSALVTGGGSGMGQLAARQFAEAGAQVAILDVNEPGMQETAAGNDNIHPYVVDITDYDAVVAAVADLVVVVAGRVDARNTSMQARGIR